MPEIRPRTPAPDLQVQTLDGDTWRLSDQSPENFTLALVYRGYHCPICKKQLEELNGKLDEFGKRGVDVIALSTDSEERARKTGEEWDIDNVKVGYGWPIETARDDWGLYISTAESDKEPAQFSEPGMFLIRPSGEVYAAWVQSTPFARPELDDLLKSIDFILDKDYPARGQAA